MESTASNEIIELDEMVDVKEYICRWAYECAIPFDAFEKDSFKMLMEAIAEYGPGAGAALAPTRYELGGTLLREEVERTKMLLKEYEEDWKLNGCSIIIDAWSDGKRSIMNMCVNSKLGTTFLSFKEFSNESHTSEHMFEYLDSCIDEVGPENVVQVVTGNAFDNMGVAKLLNEKRPTIFWTSCASHTINLMLEDADKTEFAMMFHFDVKGSDMWRFIESAHLCHFMTSSCIMWLSYWTQGKQISFLEIIS
ncbi:hypothetical protein CTI12_AA172370 [Artemisia annua]|uniref:DUF659 domain-containing protein n=1 Tax=Artemisia annua TaxID=35608 RepID=A0A2U1P2N8_ARTAN|nr:hypothetical protein CTI12_AA172370 [Artemisia annua]